MQVVLLRELSAAFFGVDLIYLLAVGAWLLWTAVGALLGRASLDSSASRVCVLLAFVGLLVPLEVALIRSLPLLLGGVPGAYLALPVQIAASALSLLPASVLLGLLFQWTAKRYLSSDPTRPSLPGRLGRSVAGAYAIESVGGVVGGLAATLTLHWRMQNMALALAAAALACGAGLLVLSSAGAPDAASARTRHVTRGLVRVFALTGLLACLVAGWNGRRLDQWMTSWTHPDAVEAADSPYGRVTITERAGQVCAYENNALVLESEGTESEDFAHLSLLQHPSPRRVLLVSGASAGLLAAVAAHRPDRIDDVDLNEQMVDLLRRHLPASFEASVIGPSVRIVFGDPRRAIAQSVEAYDVIVIAAAEPASAQANRFFTREFFDQCAAHLNPGGLISLRLSSIENLWTPPLVARTGSIYTALRQVFADVVVLPGANNIVFASGTPLTRDPDVLAARLAQRGIRARMVTPRYLRYLYANDRYAAIEALLRRDRALPNTDANAAAYQATSLLWLSKFAPSLAQVDLAGTAEAFGWSRWRSWVLLAIAAGLSLVWRLAGWPRRTALVGIAAGGGMTIETLLLVHYQLKHGVMFQDLGVLLMSVMAGLAAGAWLVDRRARRRAKGAATLPRLFFAAFVALSVATSIGIRTDYGSGLLPIAVMLGVTGALVAGVFACASHGDADQRRLVSPLYAADVLGGSVGSIAASLVLIPLLGLPLTAEWTAALMAIAILLA